MIYLNADIANFAKQHGIKLEPIPCSDCSKPIMPTIPFAIKGYRGVGCGPCDCGSAGGMFRVVPVDPDTRAIWETLRP